LLARRTRYKLSSVAIAAGVTSLNFVPLNERAIARGADDPLSFTSPVMLSARVCSQDCGFKFHQHIESTADAAPFTTLRMTRSEEQGKRCDKSRLSSIINRAKPPDRAAAQSTNHVDRFTEPIQDVLTAIYFLRTQNLDVGKSFEVLLSDSGRSTRGVNVTNKTMDTAVDA